MFLDAQYVEKFTKTCMGMKNTEISSVVTSKEEGEETGLGKRVADDFDCIYNIYIGGGKCLKKIRSFTKLAFVLYLPIFKVYLKCIMILYTLVLPN